MSPWTTPEPSAAVEALQGAALAEAKRQGLVAFVILEILPNGKIGAAVAGCDEDAIYALLEEGPEALRAYVAAIKAGLAGPGAKS